LKKGKEITFLLVYGGTLVFFLSYFVCFVKSKKAKQRGRWKVSHGNCEKQQNKKEMPQNLKAEAAAAAVAAAAAAMRVI